MCGPQCDNRFKTVKQPKTHIQTIVKDQHINDSSQLFIQH